MPNCRIYPLTLERWNDFVTLFGKRGACGGCWCMYWRLNRARFEQQKGEGNRQAMQELVACGEVPGLLAYADGQAVGWCSLGPRQSFPVLERSRILKRVDEQPVWSVVCFFVAKSHRRQGITLQLLQTALDFAREHGATIVEGYPIDSKVEKMPDVFAYTGIASIFRKAGFVEVIRRSERRPVMRCTLG